MAGMTCYLGVGEPPGRWRGRGACELGGVGESDVKAMCINFVVAGSPAHLHRRWRSSAVLPEGRTHQEHENNRYEKRDGTRHSDTYMETGHFESYDRAENWRILGNNIDDGRE